MKATWHAALLADSDDTIIVENNHYFPALSLVREHLRESTHTSTCPWKGTAHYHDVVVDDRVNKDAAWYYPDPKPAARSVRHHVAFWRGVEVTK